MPREDTQFKKGMVANPKGRPKKQDCIRDMLREELAGTVEVNGETITKAQFIAKKAFALAATGDLAAIKYLSDQVDGAPKQAVELSGKDGGPIEQAHSFRVEYVAPESDG